MVFKTIKEHYQSEIVVDKSKFIAQIQPVKTEEEAYAFIESVKKKHYNATHNVPVYRIGSEGQIHKYSDDGEPAGTAGLPVLDYLKKESISNICIVITRYYGGIKLGTGGLVRAYTGAIKSTMSESDLYEVTEFTVGSVYLDYNWYPILTHMFDKSKVCVLDTVYNEMVTVTFALENEFWSEFCDLIIEKTNGALTCQVSSTIFASRDGVRLLLF
jgi:uncharacterized YigZ family protein